MNAHQLLSYIRSPGDGKDEIDQESPEPIAAAPERDVESATTAVTLRATADEVNTLVAAAVAAPTTGVTFGSMVIDTLYSWGIRPDSASKPGNRSTGHS